MLGDNSSGIRMHSLQTGPTTTCRYRAVRLDDGGDEMMAVNLKMEVLLCSDIPIHIVPFNSYPAAPACYALYERHVSLCSGSS